MAEVDPYETSYVEHPLSKSVSRNAAKRLRKESLGRGNRARDEIEGHAPKWTNEPTAKTREPPKGSSTEFQTGSNQGGLHFNMRKGKGY